jgi:hypothetical protein
MLKWMNPNGSTYFGTSRAFHILEAFHIPISMVSPLCPPVQSIAQNVSWSNLTIEFLIFCPYFWGGEKGKVLICFVLFSCSAWDWRQGLVCARQALYHWTTWPAIVKFFEWVNVLGKLTQKEVLLVCLLKHINPSLALEYFKAESLVEHFSFALSLGCPW